MGECKAAVPEREFRRFAAFFTREPFLDEKFDFWMARLIVAVAAPWQKKGAKELDPRDLIPDWWGERKKGQPQTAKQWADLLRNFARAKGGKVLDSKGNPVDGKVGRQPGNHHQRKRKAAGERAE